MTILDENLEDLETFLKILKDIIENGNNLDNRQRRFLFKLIPYTCVIISKDSKVIEYIGKETSIFSDDLVVNKYVKDLIPQKLYSFHLEAMKYIFQSKKPYNAEIPLEIRDILRYYQITYFYYSADKAIVFLKNITRKKRKEDYKQVELKKLKELEKTRKLLIANISHELKTPIMTISNSAELLNSTFSDDLNQEEKELIDIIERGVDRLQRLVDNLLDLSEIEFKKSKLNLGSFNIDRIIKKCADDMKLLLRQKDLNLEMNLAQDTTLLIDKEKIEQVIFNLISNAIKNTQAGGHIKISLSHKRDLAKITIADNGIGLTRRERKNIFSMFGKFERKQKGYEFLDIRGSGLGLFLSKKIIEMHGGKIDALSEGRFRGSKFIVELPRSSVENFLRII